MELGGAAVISLCALEGHSAYGLRGGGCLGWPWRASSSGGDGGGGRAYFSLGNKRRVAFYFAVAVVLQVASSPAPSRLAESIFQLSITLKD